MKKIIENKVAVAMAVILFAFASAQNSVSVSFTGITEVNNIDGYGPAVFEDGGKTVDGLDITFKAVVDNVSATVGLTAGGGNAIVYDTANITVSDLFDGLLSFKFFHIGYGAGLENSIRPDIGSQGIKITVKPIDMLSISLGYGIGTKTFYTRTVANIVAGPIGAGGAAPIISGASQNFNGNYHAIQLDLGINNAFVPVTFYGGMIIGDGGDGGIKVLERVPAGTNTIDISAVLKSVALYHTSVGFTADFLAFFLPGAFVVDLGVVLPLAGAATYVDTTKTSGDYENEVNLVTILHGSMSDLGVEGFGLGYGVYFALDTYTKQVTLGDLDDDYFKEFFKISVTPSYTLGQFKFALNGVFGMIGDNTAQIIGNDPTAEGYNRFEVTPSITWSPASSASVKLAYTYEDGNLSVDDDSNMGIALTYDISVGVEGL